MSAYPGRAEADDSEPAHESERRIELRHRLALDIPLTVGLWAIDLSWIALRPEVMPTRCRLCEGDSAESVNALDEAFRDGLRRSDTTPAATLGHVFAYGVVPATSIGFLGLVAASDRRSDEVPLDLLIVAEATASASLVTEVLKPIVLRVRPAEQALDGEPRADAFAKSDTFLSFPSGHTTTAFAIAVSSGTVASMRGYRLAPLVWVSGLATAATTGYLRMASDAHYFTDVLAGAAVGSVIGSAIPLLFHGRKRAGASALGRGMIGTYEVPGGRVVTFGGSF